MMVVQCFPCRFAIIKFHSAGGRALLPLLQVLSEKGSTLQSVNNRIEFASDSKVISHGFERAFLFILFFFLISLSSCKGVLLNEAKNKNKKEKYRTKDILEYF